MPRIVQLSDLHFKCGSEWKEKFPYLVKCLNHLNPQIILITGDLVDGPSPLRFFLLYKYLKKINNDLKVPIIFVPGNHDFYLYGNALFGIKIPLFYILKYFFYKDDGGFNKVLLKIFRTYNIAIYPIDSCSGNKIFSFAQGNTRNPIKRFLKLNKRYESLMGSDKIEKNKIFKISLLHHHPVPIPSSLASRIFEPFLIMRNSYSFIEACRFFDIDIVLHGHMHMSNLMSYNFYGKDKLSDKKIIFSCCSSSSEPNEQKNEIKVIDLSNSGAINIYNYFSYPHYTEYKTENEIPYEARCYGDIRKENKLNFYKTINGTHFIENIKNKTKIVEISEDGTAFISITNTNIKWKPNIKHSNKEINERIRSDLGRVSGGLYEFCNCPIEKKSSYEVWYNPLLENGQKPNPEKSEAFDKSFYPKNPISSGEDDCFKMQYYLYGGFSLTKNDHEERYKGWKNDRPRQECISVMVDYPTDSLELIVIFPTLFFPSAKNILLEAAQKKDIGEKSMDLLYGEIPYDNDETDFLIKKSALRIRPEINQVSIIIKYPQPNIEYTLRWDLPKKHPNAASESIEQKRRNYKLAKYICEDIIKQDIDNFYKNIVQYIEDMIFADGKYHIFLLGYNSVEKYLKIVNSPDIYQDKIKGNIIIGRGPAGKAFKTKEAVFWRKDMSIEESYGIPNYPIEAVVEGMDPVGVLAIPLIMPYFISEDGQTKGITSAWGCLSIVSENDNSFGRIMNKYETNKDKLPNEISLIFRLLNIKIKELINPILDKL